MTKARRWLPPTLMIVAFLLVGGPPGSLAGKVAEVSKNDSGECRHTGQLSCQSHMSSTRVGGPYRSVATRSSVG
jgi:hypothetical protein